MNPALQPSSKSCTIEVTHKNWKMQKPDLKWWPEEFNPSTALRSKGSPMAESAPG
jgi:hypothetical protein